MKIKKVWVEHQPEDFTRSIEGIPGGKRCNVRILNLFLMEDGTDKGIEDMSDDEIIDALMVASNTGKALEKKGYSVAY